MKRLQYSAQKQSSLKDQTSVGSKVSLGKQAQHRTLDTNNDFSQEEHDLVGLPFGEAPQFTKDVSMRSISPKHLAEVRLSTNEMMGVNKH